MSVPVRRAIAEMQGYVPGEQPRGQKFIKLNTNENPYGPSPKVAAAIQAAATSLQRYPDPSATAFRIRAAEVLGVEPDWILCGNGSDDILTIVTRAFVDAGEWVRYAEPSYILYKTLAEIQGARRQVIPYEPDWSLGFAFTAAKEALSLAYLANPNSPSGTLIPPGEVAAIADALPCPLLVDEAYVDFAKANCVHLVKTNPRVMVSRTLSKSYALAGLRFGYIVAQPQVIAELQKVKDSYNCDSLSIAAATAAIDDQAWLADNTAKIRATRDRLAKGLAAKGFDVTPSQANFVWTTHPSGAHKEIYERLRSQGVLIRYMNYPNWGDGLRVSVGTDGEIDALLSLLK